MWTGPNDAPLSTKEERMQKLKRQWERIQKELKDNPRTIFQCVARGCEGCAVCKPKEE